MSDQDIELSTETPEEVAAERYASDDEQPLTVPIEANDADAAEQHTPVRDSSERWPDSVPVEVNEADAVDQHIAVPEDQSDEDDYQ